MRDRHFVIWLIGLIIAPIFLEKFSRYSSAIVYGALILLAALGIAGLFWIAYERMEARHRAHRMVRTGNHLNIDSMT